MDKGIIKVSDFGLSESIYNLTYLRFKNNKEVKLPVKWTAPESISDGVYSEKTDMVFKSIISCIKINMHGNIEISTTVVIWSDMLGGVLCW